MLTLFKTKMRVKDQSQEVEMERARKLLVEALSDLDMTDRQIAEKIGMSHENLSRLRNQSGRSMKLENFLRLLLLLPIKKRLEICNEICLWEAAS